MLKRNAKLIRTKFIQYLIPSIMTTVALQAGNIVDTILVGNILGSEVMSAVQISSTILLFIQIPGYMLGIGGSIAVGNLLGKRDTEGAGKVFSATFTTTVIFGLAFMLMSLFSEQIAVLLAGKTLLTENVASVIRIMFLGAPLIGIALQMMNYMAVDNHPRVATAYVILSNVINLISDYILLTYTPLGAKGAILSTLIGYFLALFVLIPYIRSKKRILKFINPFKNTGKMMKLATATGLPTMLAVICEMLRNLVMNIIIINNIGEDAVAVYTVCLNIVLICELVLGGVIGPMSTIGGVLYGEKDYFGIKSLSKNIINLSYILLSVLMIVLLIFTNGAAALFGIDDGELMNMTVGALRIFVLCLPVYAFNRFMTVYYQTTEKTGVSNLITVLQYCGALLPCVLAAVALAKAAGFDCLNAVMAAFIASELLTAFAAVITVNLKYKKGLFILPESTDEDVLDISVSPELEQAASVSWEISRFCEGKLDAHRANRIAVAAEEMTVNTIKHGGKSVKSIDIMMCFTDEEALLRFRDNGAPFNPTDYSIDNEGYQFGEIEVMLKLIDSVNYMRMLDFNNTTLEIKR